MRVVVLWEDPCEQQEAENLANVLVTLAPSLATAEVDKDGGITMHHNNRVLPKVLVQLRHYGEVFRQEPVRSEIRNWGGATVKNLQTGWEEVPNKAAWQDLPGLITELSNIYGVDPALVESLVRFADSAQKVQP